MTPEIMSDKTNTEYNRNAPKRILRVNWRTGARAIHFGDLSTMLWMNAIRMSVAVRSDDGNRFYRIT